MSGAQGADPLVSHETSGTLPFHSIVTFPKVALVKLPADCRQAQMIADIINDCCDIDDITADDISNASHIVLERDGEYVWFRVNTNIVNLQGIEFDGPDLMLAVAIVFWPLFAHWNLREVLDSLDRAYFSIGGSNDRKKFV